jgi:hypothetical protein
MLLRMYASGMIPVLMEAIMVKLEPVLLNVLLSVESVQALSLDIAQLARQAL